MSSERIASILNIWAISPASYLSFNIFSAVGDSMEGGSKDSRACTRRRSSFSGRHRNQHFLPISSDPRFCCNLSSICLFEDTVCFHFHFLTTPKSTEEVQRRPLPREAGQSWQRTELGARDSTQGRNSHPHRRPELCPSLCECLSIPHLNSLCCLGGASESWANPLLLHSGSGCALIAPGIRSEPFELLAAQGLSFYLLFFYYLCRCFKQKTKKGELLYWTVLQNPNPGASRRDCIT